MLQGRADKTRDKKRRGDLPTPIGHTQLTGQGDGRPCDGCGETIRTTEVRVAVSIHGALEWRFHDECYEVWESYTAP